MCLGVSVCPGVRDVPGNQCCARQAELPALQFPPKLSSPQLMGLPMTQQSSLAPASTPPSTFPSSPIPRYLARSSRRSFACLCLAWAFWASAEGKHHQGSAQPHQASTGAHRVQHHWSTTTSWHPPCLGRGLAAGDGEGRLLRGLTSFEGPAVAPRELLASGGAPSVAAGAGGWLPWGSVSVEPGAAAWTGTGWPAVWGNASSLGCFIPAGLGGTGGDWSPWGGTLCAEGTRVAGLGDTGCPGSATAGGPGRSRCGGLLSEWGIAAGGQTGCWEGGTAAGTGETIFSEGMMAAGMGGMVFSEGMTSGGPGRSCWGKLRSPCRAPPGTGGGTEGGGMLSPIGDGGFPARGTEQVTQLGKPVKDLPKQLSGDTALSPQTHPSGARWGGRWNPTSALLLLPQSWRAPAVGARSWAHNAQRDSRAPPGTAATKLPFIPWQLPPGPAVGGHGARDPPTGTGTHTLPCHSPRGDEDVERFRGTVGCAGGRMGAGRGLTSPWQPVAPIAPRPAAMTSRPRNAHQAARQSPLPAWGRPWGSTGISPVLGGRWAP